MHSVLNLTTVNTMQMADWAAEAADGAPEVWKTLFFNMAVKEARFKNGAFQGLITKATPPLEAADIFLKSNLLSAEETALVEKVRVMLLRALNLRTFVPRDEPLVLDFGDMIGVDPVAGMVLMPPGGVGNVAEVVEKQNGVNAGVAAGKVGTSRSESSATASETADTPPTQSEAREAKGCKQR